jgi:uncharacterized protein (TIGR03437 family)
VGYPVTIIGQHFGASQGSSTVSFGFPTLGNFGAIPASVISWSDTQIVVEVPDLVAGVYDVTVTTNACQSNAVQFQVTACQVEIINSTVQRAEKSKIEATITPLTFLIHHVDWIFTGGKGGTKKSGQQLSIQVTMVDGDNPYTVEVRVFSNASTVACMGTALIDVTPRSGSAWELIPTVRLDNEASWVGRKNGMPPSCNDGTLLEEERDRKSNLPAIIIPSPFTSKSWEDGYRIAQIKDKNGPNDGYWYIANANKMKIDQETVIDKWLKPNGPPPARRQPNWFQHNASSCSVDPAEFLQAVENHENSGSGPGSTGHFGLIRDTLALLTDMDPRTAIENKFSEVSQQDLIDNTNKEISVIEALLQYAAMDTPTSPTGNWSVSDPDPSFWDPALQAYSPCICADRAF